MIRKAYETDIPGIALLEQQCFSDPWSQKSLRYTLREENSFFLVAEEYGKIIGYLNSTFILDECSLNRICVDGEKRRQHLGSKMLRELILFCDEKGIRYINLEVRESNFPAQRLYHSFGFLPLWKKEAFYQNPSEAAIIMQRRKEDQNIHE